MSTVYYVIPKGTEPSDCPRGCAVQVYWIEAPRAGYDRAVVRIPIDTSPKDCAEPDSLSDGRGVNHFLACVGDA
jgi:hypothetical protein